MKVVFYALTSLGITFIFPSGYLYNLIQTSSFQFALSYLFVSAMSFGLPPVKGPFEGQKDLGLVTGPFGVQDTFGFGIKKVKENIEPCHPLELSEKNYALRQEKLNLAILRNNQGLHAPFKIMAELRATSQVGRLPFLASSDLASATIRNSDDFIDFTDFLNHPDHEEKFFIPHVITEHKLGIL